MCIRDSCWMTSMQYRSFSTIWLIPRTCPSILFKRARTADLSSAYPGADIVTSPSLVVSRRVVLLNDEHFKHAVGVVPRLVTDELVPTRSECSRHPTRSPR